MDPHKPRATDATQLAADAGTEPHPATLAVHAADADLLTCGGATPLYLDNAFSFESAEALEAVFAGRAPGYVYSRIANPTVAHLERVVAALEGGIGAVACASGMAAISSAVLALAGAGDEIVVGSSLFGGTHSLFRQTLSRYGITTRFVSATDPAAYEAAINERTRALFVEVIGNPRLDVPDLAAIGAVARAHGVALLVDSTAATPILVRPGQLGAAIVIHSTSKFLQGHGTAIGGIIVDCGTFDWSGSRYGHLATLYRRARQLTLLAYLRNQICRDLGCCLAPFNDIVIDGTDSFAAKFLVADACHFAGKPYVHAGILRFDGQIMTVLPGQSACYRCAFRAPPPAGAVPSCSQAGVLGALAGVIGTLQAVEVLKFLIGQGTLLTDRLLVYNGLQSSFRTVPLRRSATCPLCSDHPTITELRDETPAACTLGGRRT